MSTGFREGAWAPDKIYSDLERRKSLHAGNRMLH
jgi:hypothetical protein